MTEYRLRSDVRWVVESNGLIVSAGGRAQRLDCREAAVWDLLSRGYPFTKVVALTAHIGSLDARTAEAFVRDNLERWSRSGLLEKTPTWPTSR